MLIDQGHSFTDCPIHRDDLSSVNDHAVPRLHLRKRDLNFLTIEPYPHRAWLLTKDIDHFLTHLIMRNQRNFTDEKIDHQR